MSVFVLDTSAVLTVLNGEDGLQEVLDLLDQSKDGQVTLYLPFMALMELEYLALRRAKAEETQVILGLVNAWPVEQVESTDVWRHRAAEVKAISPLSVADAWIASLALLHDAQLVHKDPEFEQVPGLNTLKLPYRKDLA